MTDQVARREGLVEVVVVHDAGFGEASDLGFVIDIGLERVSKTLLHFG